MHDPSGAIGPSGGADPGGRANDPHAGMPVHVAGPRPDRAAATLILLHGRGADAAGMLRLFERLDLPDVAAVAPEASGRTWYPRSFLAPLHENQPHLDSALRRVLGIVEHLSLSGVPVSRVALLGFSQGACLACEFVVRHPRRYGALLALSGGIIGPPGDPRLGSSPAEGFVSLDGLPVFLGASDPDPHVPFSRVLETDAVLSALGAVVETRRYPGMGHAINEEELDIVSQRLKRLAEGDGGRSA